jgi:dissimilatory sulfite reductase related protein
MLQESELNHEPDEQPMPPIELEGRTFAVDNKGFLKTPEIWDQEVAALFARAQGIDALTDDHWKVLNYIRAYWLEHGRAPMIRVLCERTGLRLKQVYDLFPEGPAQGACRIAGLPKPEGCV